MKQEQLAINSISTRHRDLPAALAAYAHAGFRQVEFSLPHVHTWLDQGHTVTDVRDLLATHRLRAIGGFETHVACFAEPSARRANQERHRRNVQLIHDLGGGTLVVGTDGPAQPSLDTLDTVVTVFRELLATLDGLNVTVALEFNWSPLIKSLDSAVRVVQAVNHPRLGVLFDPAHYYTTPTKFEQITAETVPWIKHVHLDDMRDKPGDLSHCNDDRVLPGEGILDLAALIAALERHGYANAYSLELFNKEIWELPVEEAARRCYQSLLPLCA